MRGVHAPRFRMQLVARPPVLSANSAAEALHLHHAAALGQVSLSVGYPPYEAQAGAMALRAHCGRVGRCGRLPRWQPLVAPSA